MNKAACPLCGKEGHLEPHPTLKERAILNCSCHPAGPVLETDAPVLNEKKESK
jgi:hypothetical protein